MAPAQIQAMLGEALKRHQAGHLNEAALLYRKILGFDPTHADTLYLLGMVVLGQGQAHAAADLTRKAIALRGGQAGYHFQLGAALQTLGDMEGALDSYRRSLALKPEDPDTFNNMGNVLAALGKPDEAESLFRRALALQPRNAVAHCSLGAVQWHRRDIDAAEASFREAVALDHGYAAAIVNLGNVHREKGRLNQAETCYRRAVALEPHSAGTQGSLGLVLWDLGRHEEAMRHYRRALECDPAHVETLANLGLALWDQGALDEAEAMFARALSLRPADTGLLNNSAALLMARGKGAAAMEMIRRSLAVQETARAKRLFVDLASLSGWNGASEEIRAVMARALTEPWDRPARLGRAAAQLIMLDPGIGRAVEAAAAAWPARLSSTRLLGPAGFAALADNMLLMALLTSAPNTDIALERFLTMARAALLGAALPREITADDKTLRFAGALAQQCFINEFIFMADETEIAEAKMLCETLAAALDSGEAIPPVQLLAAASYFPLMHLRGGERLLERLWPPAVQEVLTRQLREPLEERRLRAEIPRLTDIGSGTSQLVQRQYEENPYPRWVRVAPASRDNIVSFLSAKFPSARFERNPGRPMRDFLIAGCGTGQQSILAAQKFGDGHMLAVDLSLSSLCYARRKSNELGLKIAYGQADILELASLGRQFDVIECMGVLHHMADPYAGWKTLLALLRPNGFMEVGVYSAAARRPIHAVREEIAANGLGAADLRAFRQGLMPSRDPGVQAAILKSEDFFTTSACRDLLFHVQEQGLTIGGIKAFLLEHGLAFLGFELDDAVVDAYRRRFRDDPAAVDLDHWAAFEADHPGMFAGMYRFWIWKSGQS